MHVYNRVREIEKELPPSPPLMVYKMNTAL
jgi:hypothetical protein